MEPVPRPAARVVLVDGRDRVLLFLAEDPRLDTPRVWHTPGGGVRAGETYEAAARRELWEETGLRAEPGPCVWTRRHVFRLGDRRIDARERFFLVRVAGTPAVAPAALEGIEKEVLVGHRWWSAAGIAAAEDEVFAPRRLARLLEPLLDGTIPPDPIDTGV